MAADVSSSHLPLGKPLYEPSLANAVWISLMRSLVGVFWPGCLRDFFEVLPAVLAEDLPEGFAVDFLLDATGACCPLALAAVELLARFFIAAGLFVVFVWPKPTGTLSPVKEQLSRIKSAGRIIFIGFDFLYEFR
jgi:hypothetical protein